MLNYQVLDVAWEVLDVYVAVLVWVYLVILYELGKHGLNVYLAVRLLCRLRIVVLVLRRSAVVESTL